MDMGRGFLFLSTPSVMVTKKVLALTPLPTPWGQCIFQEWEPNFNPDYPAGLKLPTWISLTKLPHEFKPVEGLIAATLGPVYQADPQNKFLRDPRFCVGLDLTQGWPSALAVRGLGNHLNTIILNYEHAPIRCRFCLNLNHRVADCDELKLNGSMSPTAPPNPQAMRQQAPAQASALAIVTPHRQAADQNRASDMPIPHDDGFTVVRPRKSKTPPKQPSHSQYQNQPGCQAPSGHAEAAPNQPILTSDQVMDMLANNEAEDGLPMSWSPGRYGRNPGSKRSAGIASRQNSPVRSNASSKRLLTSPPVLPQPAQVRIPDPEGDLCILLDTPPAVAFRQIEAIKRQSNQAQPSSASSSSLGLEHFPTQHLGSPDGQDIEQNGSPGAISEAPAPQRSSADPFLLTDVTSKAGRQNIPDLNDSGSETSSRVNSIKIAASYKAKWEAVNRRLDAAAANQAQPDSNSPLNTPAS
ncbi:hypothetical protein KC19_VG322700 [Ceratodon purpureus]|uniref:DUF4283 domain-containing protein n=1 Tax=Ceratodon purpureus TaxID=3225 RepID=A0A8T0HWJ3_CERPU|nr:hypothetical protein KC19_VG322700 [Ceratodon purpureus]